MTSPIAAQNCTDSLQDAVSQLESRFAESVVQIGNAQVSYRSCGHGSVVVLLHGISSGAPSWLPCALRLSQDAHVIAWNAPGYGRSSPLAQAQPTAADYALRLEQFLTALGIERCLLVGHSLGAMMAGAYVGGGYRRASKLLLLSPAQGYGCAAKRAQGEQIAQQRLDDLHSIGVAGMAERGPARMLSSLAGAAERAWVRWNIQELNAAGYTQAVHMLCGDELRAYAADGAWGRVPASVMCGALDVVTTPAASLELARDLDVPFELIDNAGHACYIERAGTVAAALRDQLFQLT